MKSQFQPWQWLLLIAPGEELGRTTGEIACREGLGGLLRYYYREAA
jgi:hypothetical protein